MSDVSSITQPGIMISDGTRSTSQISLSASLLAAREDNEQSTSDSTAQRCACAAHSFNIQPADTYTSPAALGTPREVMGDTSVTTRVLIQSCAPLREESAPRAARQLGTALHGAANSNEAMPRDLPPAWRLVHKQSK